MMRHDQGWSQIREANERAARVTFLAWTGLAYVSLVVIIVCATILVSISW